MNVTILPTLSARKHLVPKRFLYIHRHDRQPCEGRDRFLYPCVGRDRYLYPCVGRDQLRTHDGI